MYIIIEPCFRKIHFESVKYDCTFCISICIFLLKTETWVHGCTYSDDYFIAEKRVNSHLFPNLSIKNPAPITTKAFL